MSPTTVLLMLKLMDGLIMLVQAAPAVKADMSALSAKIQTMVAEGRDPTPEEWNEINAVTESLHRRIQDA